MSLIWSQRVTSSFENVVAAAFPLNPEPWAMGKVQVIPLKNKKRITKITPNQVLKMYQNALEDELVLTGLHNLPGPYYSIRFTFSRQLTKTKIASGATLTRNWADVTNMQKGTEDAMQGGSIDNDRHVIRVESRLHAEQRSSTLPFVVIEVRHSVAEFNPEATAICHSTEMFSPAGQQAWEEMIRAELGGNDITDNEWEP